MSEVRNWLERIGLDQYADAFEANDIDVDLLKQIDDQLLGYSYQHGLSALHPEILISFRFSYEILHPSTSIQSV